MKRTLFLFAILILFSGCHSFFLIDKNEFNDLNDDNSIKIVFIDGEKKEINNVSRIRLTDKNEIELISINRTTSKNDTIYYYFPKENIKEIRVKKIDIPKSIITPLFLTMGAFFALAILLVIMYPTGFSVG